MNITAKRCSLGKRFYSQINLEMTALYDAPGMLHISILKALGSSMGERSVELLLSKHFSKLSDQIKFVRGFIVAVICITSINIPWNKL